MSWSDSMRAFDSSSIIYAWDNYPIGMFPPMWRWIENEIREQKLVFSAVSKKEVKDNSPDCAEWLEACEPTYLPASPAILMKALEFKGLLDIVEDKYGTGVGENDLIIIATAHVHGVELVSDEAKQPKLPQQKLKYKIPAVCSLPQVGVRCLNFLDFLKTVNQVFMS